MLLIAFLREAGIEANLTLVNTLRGQRLDEEIPSPLAFNHAIVTFVLDKRNFHVDPTTSSQGGRLEDLSIPDFGKGLIIKSENSALIPIRSHQCGEIVVEENYTLLNDENQAAKFVVKTTYTGHEADVMRSSISYTSTWDLQKSYLDYYNRLYTQVIREGDIELSDDREKNRLIITEKYIIGEFLKKANGRLHAEFHASTIAERLPDISSQRLSPLSVPAPGITTYYINLIGLGTQISPDTYFIDRNSYAFGSNTRNRGDTIKTMLTLRFHEPYVPAEQLETYIEDVRNFKNNHVSFSIHFPEEGLGIGSSSLNWWMTVYSILFLGVTAFIGRWLFLRKTPLGKVPHDEAERYNRIGGWMILPLMGFSLTALLAPFYFISERSWATDTWNAMNGNNGVNTFKFLLFLETTQTLFIFSTAVICLIFMLNKRTLFPKLARIYYSVVLGLSVISYVTYIILLQSIDDPQMSGTLLSIHQEYVQALLYAFIAAAIWIPYFVYSKRVKGTFVNP